MHKLTGAAALIFLAVVTACGGSPAQPTSPASPPAPARPDFAAIRDYYDASWPDYRLLWLRDGDLAIHFGYWDELTRSHAGSLTNMNRALAQRIGVRPGREIHAETDNRFADREILGVNRQRPPGTVADIGAAANLSLDQPSEINPIQVFRGERKRRQPFNG